MAFVAKMPRPLNIIYGILLLCLTSNCQLVVNVKNKGGDVVVEAIQANVSADTVQLNFQNKDGTLVHQLIDYKHETQIFRAHVSGEEEQGFSQNPPQVLCFVTHFNKNDFITADAMSKLRQKNPMAIRVPEEEKPLELYTVDIQVNLDRSHFVSPHVYNMCEEARETTFTKEVDLRLWTKTLGKDGATLMSSGHRTYPSKYQHCHQTEDLSKPCLCTYNFTIGWYPCGLKYCRGKDSTGKYVSYRCGIKTCKRRLSYEFVSRQKMFCLWDDL